MVLFWISLKFYKHKLELVRSVLPVALNRQVLYCKMYHDSDCTSFCVCGELHLSMDVTRRSESRLKRRILFWL
jgi:hypothetical protein